MLGTLIQAIRYIFELPIGNKISICFLRGLIASLFGNCIEHTSQMKIVTRFLYVISFRVKSYCRWQLSKFFNVYRITKILRNNKESFWNIRYQSV